MRLVLVAALAASTITLAMSPAQADDPRSFLRRLNGRDESIVRSLMVGGHPTGATPELRALAIALTGGRTGAEAHTLRVLEVGGSPSGGASRTEEVAHLIRTGGRTPAERHTMAVLERGGHPSGGATDAQRAAARLRASSGARGRR